MIFAMALRGSLRACRVAARGVSSAAAGRACGKRGETSAVQRLRMLAQIRPAVLRARRRCYGDAGRLSDRWCHSSQRGGGGGKVFCWRAA